MISIEAYRSSVGSFLPVARRLSKGQDVRNKPDIKFNPLIFNFLNTFLFVMFFIIIYLNLNMSFIKMMILLGGDIESNPGPPFTISKTVQGSFHQGDVKFGDTAGKQCACITLFSIAWSKIRRVGLWTSGDLDHIVTQGDKLYKHLETDNLLTVDDLPHLVNLEYNDLSIVTKLQYEEGEMTFDARNVFSSYSESDGFLLFIDNYTVAVLWNKAHVFLFDSHSRDMWKSY